MTSDLDDLLADPEMVFYRVYRDVLAAIGHKLILTDYLSGLSGRPIRPTMVDFIFRFGLPVAPEGTCARVESEEVEACRRGVPLRSGACQLFKDLCGSGLSIALRTSSTHERASSVLEAHGVLDYSNVLICVEDITRGKSNPQVFLGAVIALGTASAHCFVLEDSEMGIEAVHAASIPIVYVSDLKQSDGAHRVITMRVLNSLAEVSPQLLATFPHP